MKRALITGITGQDGSYLAELLLAKGYEVHGLVRRSSSVNIGRLQTMVETGRIDAVYDAPAVGELPLHLHYGDLNDGMVISRLVQEIGPDEVYNLAAMSHVQVSFDMPEYTASTNGGGTVRLLEAIRAAKLDCRYYQASTSEMFGLTPPPQNEDAPHRTSGDRARPGGSRRARGRGRSSRPTRRHASRSAWLPAAGMRGACGAHSP